mmetsp:Transcript_9070/g.23884  ORF Transcript_9070/g.23884 Transcript_9070/m.23884 type:complete len:90 (+) Transcript_9070:406-675(+)
MRSLRGNAFSIVDCLYYEAVGHFRCKRTKEARDLVLQLLSCTPACRQAISFLDMIDDRIATEQLLGVGSTAALSLILCSLVMLALWRRR